MVRRASTVTLVLGVAVAAPGILAALAGPASAKSCIGHAYEHMDVELVSVRQGGKVVPRPTELPELGQALNSGDGGKGILFWASSQTMGFGKFYTLDHTDPPTPKVHAYIDAMASRRLSTSCGYDVAYTPILPGRYVFSEEHSTGAKVSVGIDTPVLTVATGRGELTLEFGVRGVRYEAHYRVKCAHFDWEPGKETACAPFEASAALLGAPSVAPVDSTPVTIPAPSGSAAPVVIETHDVSSSKRSSCGACDVGAGSSGAGAPFMLVGVALLAFRRRRRSRGYQTSIGRPARSQSAVPARNTSNRTVPA